MHTHNLEYERASDGKVNLGCGRKLPRLCCQYFYIDCVTLIEVFKTLYTQRPFEALVFCLMQVFFLLFSTFVMQ